MPAPLFIDYNPETPITASWLNTVSNVLWNVLGNGNQPPSDVGQLLANLGVSGYVPSVASLASISGSENTQVLVLGYYGPFTKGGGLFSYLAGDTTPVDGVVYFAGLNGPTGSGRWIRQNASKVTLWDAGAYGDGVLGTAGGHDDTAAIQRWASVLSANRAGVIGQGVYNFSIPWSIPAQNRICIENIGATSGVFQWIGPNTTGTAGSMITFGDGVTACSYWEVQAIGIETAVKMIDGAMLRVKKFMVNNHFGEVNCGMINNNGNVYHGAWFDVVNVCFVDLYNATQGAGDGIRFNGTSTDDSGSDLLIKNGSISGFNVGVHQGGGFGGFRSGDLNCFRNQTNYLVDTSIASRLNREVFISPGFASDGAGVAGVILNDTLTSNAPVAIDGFIGSSGQFGGAGPFHGLWVQNWPNGRISIISGEIFNNLGSGIRLDDASCIVTTSDVTHIFNNTQYGVSAAHPTFGFYFGGGYMAQNGAGNFDSNINGYNGDTLNVTMVAGSGTITAYSATMFLTKIGKIVTGQLTAGITNSGTSGTNNQITCPFTVRGEVSFTGRDNNTGKAIVCHIPANSNIMTITFADNTFAGATGAVFNVGFSIIVQ